MSAIWIVLIILEGAFAVGAATFVFLTAPKRVDKKQYAWLTQADFAHRGLYTADQKIPENSMAAFSRTIQEGYGMELDVELTSDDVLVVFH
ncbi:MAG: glycerophosphodiester phosphodiesterase family protein, partial [Clostridia bacterium]|nr:glycerophosphodiester phosphodiesterase family protein [Clostridia bacterium]